MLDAAAHSPLLTAVAAHARLTPGKAAIVVGDERVTYAALAERIDAASRRLAAGGLVAGDRMLLSASKDVDFVATYLAAHALGVVNVVVDPESPGDRLGLIVEATTPRATHGLPAGGVPGLPTADCGCDDALPGERPGGHAVGRSLVADDVADIMFTTGTTGRPKGVCLSHANLAAAAANINAFVGNDGTDTEVLALPLCHSFGLGRLRCTLLAGGTVVLLPSFANLKRFFDALERHRATGFGMVPAVWHYIRRYSGTRLTRFAPQLRYIEIGSAPLEADEKRLLIDLFPTTRLCMHYGLTEASRALFMELHECRDRLDTIGRPATSSVEAAIVGPDGEICLKGDIVTRAYLDSADNAAAFDGGYFHTGDCGRRDEQGYFYLTGRIKEIINIGGKKVAPATIEQAIIRAGAADCAVVATADPGGVLGEVPAALVVPGGTTLEAVKASAAQWLEPYQMPVLWREVKQIPRTPSGKPRRLLLKQQCGL